MDTLRSDTALNHGVMNTVVSRLMIENRAGRWNGWQPR